MLVRAVRPSHTFPILATRLRPATHPLPQRLADPHPSPVCQQLAPRGARSAVAAALHRRHGSTLTSYAGHGNTVPMFINGEFVESKTDTFIDVINPVPSPPHTRTSPRRLVGPPLRVPGPRP